MIIWVCLFLPLLINGSFHDGDFVQMSRRGQVQGQRTSWHDLQGRHCPRFNRDSLVVVPINKPKLLSQVDEFKIQLSFDHERLFSSWIPVLGPMHKTEVVSGNSRGYDEVLIPFVTVTLWKKGDELIQVRVAASRIPEKQFGFHDSVVQEFRNRDHWPKHVLIKSRSVFFLDLVLDRYNWKSLDEIDAERGFMVLIYGGLFLIIATVIGVLYSSERQVEELIKEMFSDKPQEGASRGFQTKAE